MWELSYFCQNAFTPFYSSLIFCLFVPEMRIATSILLIFIVSLVSFQETTFYAFFKLNQDYIAKYLCIEKEIKDSKCNGHCQLTKILDENKETRSPDKPFPSFEPTKIELFLMASDIHLSPTEPISGSYFYLTEFDDSDFINSIFHPPTS